MLQITIYIDRFETKIDLTMNLSVEYYLRYKKLTKQEYNEETTNNNNNKKRIIHSFKNRLDIT